MSKSPHSTIIAPSLLAADLANLSTEINSVVSAGADWLHVDVMDGHFVPPITFGDNMVAAAKRCCSLPLDVHLMVQNPDSLISAFAKAGATRLIVHQETCPHLHRTLSAIKAAGMHAGVAINPATPVETIFPVLELVDLVLVMTVNPGFGGQSFIESCLGKISAVAAELAAQNLPAVRIEVDGGINQKTAAQCVAAGASVLVAGTAVFGAADRGAAMKGLR